jgi:hypothetical protein
MEIKSTMPLGDWKILKGQLDDNKWPECDLRRKICDIIYVLAKTFTPDLYYSGEERTNL